MAVISICIPAFKAERFIGKTLESIRAQTFGDWELIVIEDGSHDETEQLVRAFAGIVAQPVKFERHAENRGLPATRNTCIARAAGDWIALIDADDLWTPDHLESALRRGIETGADLVHTGVVLFDSETERDIELRAPSAAAIADFPRSLFVGDYAIQPSSVLVRRDICERTGGFDPGCRFVEDREFWLRLVRAGAKVAFVQAVTCRYRQHGGAMTRNAAAMAAGCAEVLDRNADWQEIPLNIRRQTAANGWLSAGRIVMARDPKLARQYFERALRHRMASPRLLAYWLAAVLLGVSKRPARFS